MLTLGRSITDGFRQILPVRQEDPLRRVLHLFGASVLFFFIFGLYRRVHMSATLSVIAPLDLLLPSVIDPCGAGRVERAAAGSIPNSRVTDEMKSERKRERELSLFTNLDIKKKLENILVVDQLPRKWSNSVSNAEAGSKLARAFFFLSLFFHRQVGHLTVLSYQRINDQAVSGD